MRLASRIFRLCLMMLILSIARSGAETTVRTIWRNDALDACVGDSSDEPDAVDPWHRKVDACRSGAKTTVGTHWQHDDVGASVVDLPLEVGMAVDGKTRLRQMPELSISPNSQVFN